LNRFHGRIIEWGGGGGGGGGGTSARRRRVTDKRRAHTWLSGRLTLSAIQVAI